VGIALLLRKSLIGRAGAMPTLLLWRMSFSRSSVAKAVSHRLENTNRFSIFALSHFRTENRMPLFLKMLYFGD
jgi:hypothetical protein